MAEEVFVWQGSWGPEITEVDFEELLGSLKKLFEERVSYYRQVDKIVRDDYSSAEICARNIYYSILS